VSGERERRRRAQLGGHLGPRSVEQLVARSDAGVERLEQPALPVEPVLDVLVELRPRVPDVGTVSGAERLEVELAQSAQRIASSSRAVPGSVPNRSPSRYASTRC